MSTAQHEALRWARILEFQAQHDGSADYKHRAAAELRRLHDVTTDLLNALERIANGQEMQGSFTHAETVVRYQEIAREAVVKVRGQHGK